MRLDIAYVEAFKVDLAAVAYGVDLKTAADILIENYKMSRISRMYRKVYKPKQFEVYLK